MSDRFQKIRVMQLNAENLFCNLDHPLKQDMKDLREGEWQRHSISKQDNKPLIHLRHLAQVISFLDVDILCLCEVGGLHSLEVFNQHFLNDQYVAHLIEGNSDRGIDIGFLTRKELALEFKLETHKDRVLAFHYADDTRELKLSRDIAELQIFAVNDSGPRTLKAIFFLVHLKSQIDREGIDPGGRKRRAAECELLVEVMRERRAQVSLDVPFVLAGDFNGIVFGEQSDPEFESLRNEAQLVDVLEHIQVPIDERYTHLQIVHFNVEPIRKQLDGIFVSKHHADRLLKSKVAFVYRYRDSAGNVLPPPRYMSEKRQLPSDHYPVVVDLNV